MLKMTERKTVAQYKIDEQIRDAVEDERNISDKTYAIKLAERVVFGMVGIILTAVLVALVALVVANNHG